MATRSAAIAHHLPGTGFAVLLLVFSLTLPAPSLADPGDTELVSVHFKTPTDNHSVYTHGISSDGRYVLFSSSSPALVPGPSNGSLVNHLVRDRIGGTTVRANLSASGQPVSAGIDATLSADGRYVAFVASGNDVVPGDTNNNQDVYLRDLRAGVTERVSLTSAGQQYAIAYAPSLSADGRYVAFVARDTNLTAAAIHVRDRLNWQTQTLEVAGLSTRGGPLLSGDGRYLVYLNFERLVTYDRTTGQVDLVNVGLGGGLANALCTPFGVSADGRFVLFVTSASNLVADDTDDSTDVYLRDRQRQVTERVSVTHGAPQWSAIPPSVVPRMSADGRYIVFDAMTRTVGGFVIDDIFRRDRVDLHTVPVNYNSSSVLANGHSDRALVSDDGRFVAFTSEGSNLAAGDSDKFPDAFVHEMPGQPTLPVLTVSPGKLDFGSVPVGSVSAKQTVTVKNGGTSASLSINWIGLAGEDRAQFASTRHCPGVLPAGASCTADVFFKPTTAGVQSGRLVVSTMNGTLRKSVSLSGTGL